MFRVVVISLSDLAGLENETPFLPLWKPSRNFKSYRSNSSNRENFDTRKWV